MKKPRQSRLPKRRTMTIITVTAAFALLGLALLLRSGAAPNPNLTGDLNDDNKVTVTDLSILLTNWGKTTDTADINKDGKTNITDLSTLLSNWGKTATTPNPPGPTPNPPNPNPGPTPTPGGLTCDQAGVQQLVNSVSQTSVDTLMREIVQDDTKPKPNQLISRHVSSPGNKQKTDWARAKFTSWGLQDVSQNFTSAGYNLTNSIGRINGTTTPNVIYGAGGHIDATNSNDSDEGENIEGEPAPGADDNASGTVMAMEAGRVLVQFKHCLKSTLDFVGFNDEEENMKGSEVYVASVKSSKTMKGFFNADMVGYKKSGQADCLKSDTNLSVDAPLAKKIVEMNTKYGVGVNVTTGKYTVDDIDNASFWSANLPSTYLVDCATEVDAGVYPNYHSSDDTVTASNISMSQITKLTKLVVAAMAEYGMQ